MNTTRLLIASAAFAFAPAFLVAQEGDERLREALRTTTAQLRTAQSELAVAQSERERSEEQIVTLERRIETLLRQSSADQAAAQDNIRDLRADLAESQAEAKRLAGSLLEWTSAHEDVAAVAREKERQLGESGERIVDLENEITRLRSHNRELHRLGLDILERYEGFGTGRALAAREPFTRITRARLQTIIQDYRDNLDDNRIDPLSEPES